MGAKIRIFTHWVYFCLCFGEFDWIGKGVTVHSVIKGNWKIITFVCG